jgi:hypothetical protein
MTRVTNDERFLAKVRRPAKLACWEWVGAVTAEGVGTFEANGHTTTAHRYSWLLHNGPVPEGLHVARQPGCHQACVNPAHLVLQTPGKKAANKKLCDNDIREMRQLRDEGWTLEKLANEYDISVAMVWRICKFLSYRDVK